MISGLFWGVFGGLKLWGDWFNSAIGLGALLALPEQLDSPLMHRMSLMNITLLIGAFCGGADVAPVRHQPAAQARIRLGRARRHA